MVPWRLTPNHQSKVTAGRSVTVLKTLKQCFSRILPTKDGRANTSPHDFIAALVFTFFGDTKQSSLEGFRRQMMSHLGVELKRSSFWERLSRDRMVSLLERLVSELIMRLTVPVLAGRLLLEQLGVSAIYVVDSSSITLRAAASDSFRGTRTAAAVKWHACIDLLKGSVAWYQVTPGKTHDRKCFPELALLKGKLVIYDLGYWDYGLLAAIAAAGGFYLSRVKANAVLVVTEVVQGVGKKALGKSLGDLPLRKKRASLIEVFCEKVDDGEVLRFRVIGFWNPVSHQYHWYVTNLTVLAAVIYPLYRLRWQIELMFKGCKQSLNMNGISSSSKNIIKSLLLASIAAYLSSQALLRNSLDHLTEEQKFAVTYQRIAKVSVNISYQVLNYLLTGMQESYDRAMEKIILFSRELFDPNYHHRKTSLREAQDALG